MPNEPQLSNDVGAALYACLRQPLETPIRIRLQSGEADSFLSAMRIKLSRERAAAEKMHLEYTPFFLSCYAIERGEDCDVLVVARALSKRTQMHEIQFLAAFVGATWEDRLAHFLRFRDTTQAQQMRELRELEARNDAWKKMPLSTFDVIQFREAKRKMKEEVQNATNARANATVTSARLSESARRAIEELYADDDEADTYDGGAGKTGDANTEAIPGSNPGGNPAPGGSRNFREVLKLIQSKRAASAATSTAATVPDPEQRKPGNVEDARRFFDSFDRTAGG